MWKKIAALLVCAAVLCSLPQAGEAARKSSSDKKTQKITSVKNNQSPDRWKIKVSQQKLKELGYSRENPNGKMTDATIKAIKDFQKHYKLKVNGRLDDKTYRKLNWEAFARTGITNVKGSSIVKTAAKLKGVPYKFGGTSPKGFDCSGYVQYVFGKQKAKLPRSADEQVLKGVFVTQKQLKPGDLVFFTTYAAGASHVGIYASGGKFWHTSSSKGVMLSSLKEDYWKKRYYGARRVLVDNGEI